MSDPNWIREDRRQLRARIAAGHRMIPTVLGAERDAKERADRVRGTHAAVIKKLAKPLPPRSVDGEVDPAAVRARNAARRVRKAA